MNTQQTDSEPLPASDLFGHWAPKAYAALKGAEVLARCLAEAKVELGEAIEAEHFLGNNDNFLAIMDAIRAWPNS
jgi:hypothetical protein